jgi:hypothetical protein
MWPLMLLNGLKSVGVFLLQYWKEVIICLMIAVIVYDNFATKRYFFDADTIPYLRVNNVLLTNELKTAATANNNLTNDILGLNSVVNDWESKTKDLITQNAELQTKLNTMTVANNKKVQTILANPTPTTCENSIQFLRDQQKVLVWGSQ